MNPQNKCRPMIVVGHDSLSSSLLHHILAAGAQPVIITADKHPFADFKIEKIADIRIPIIGKDEPENGGKGREPFEKFIKPKHRRY